MSPRAAIALTLLGGAAYAIASHQLMTHAAGSPLALASVLGPIAIGALIGLWRRGKRALALALGAAGVTLVAVSSQGGSIEPKWLYLAQHAGVHAALGFWFGSTLRPGAMPLITQIARRVHRPFQDAMLGYTRQVTVAWTFYFFIMSVLSFALFANASFSAWSLFANVVTPVVLGLFFVAEYLLRYRLHPEFERVRLMDAARAFSQRGQDDGAVTRT
jgi:uncharacterized membrane protein